MVESFPNGDRLLVGRDIGDLDGFARQIKMAVLLTVVLILVLAGVASILITRRTVGRSNPSMLLVGPSCSVASIGKSRSAAPTRMGWLRKI